MQSAQAAVVVGQETLAVAQHLRRLAAVIPDITALTHDGVDKEIPAGANGPAGACETVAEKGPMGVFAMVSVMRAPKSRLARNHRK